MTLPPIPPLDASEGEIGISAPFDLTLYGLIVSNMIVAGNRLHVLITRPPPTNERDDAYIRYVRRSGNRDGASGFWGLLAQYRSGKLKMEEVIPKALRILRDDENSASGGDLFGTKPPPPKKPRDWRKFCSLAAGFGNLFPARQRSLWEQAVAQFMAQSAEDPAGLAGVTAKSHPYAGRPGLWSFDLLRLFPTAPTTAITGTSSGSGGGGLISAVLSLFGGSAQPTPPTAAAAVTAAPPSNGWRFEADLPPVSDSRICTLARSWEVGGACMDLLLVGNAGTSGGSGGGGGGGRLYWVLFTPPPPSDGVSDQPLVLTCELESAASAAASSAAAPPFCHWQRIPPPPPPKPDPTDEYDSTTDKKAVPAPAAAGGGGGGGGDAKKPILCITGGFVRNDTGRLVIVGMLIFVVCACVLTHAII